MSLSVSTIKTKIFRNGDDLLAFLEESLQNRSLEGQVLAITSKIISLAEKCVLSKAQITKKEVVEQEADRYLCEGGFGVELTITRGILIPSAGIDESNSESDSYILYPANPYRTAEEIGCHLKTKFNLKNFGVILTDSHSMPLRRGVTGISLAHWGFRGVTSLVGQMDIFRKPLKFTHVNVADSLAVMAVFAMGEADNQTPLALVSGATVEFTEESSEQDIRIEPENDIYYPLLAPHLK